MLMLAPMTASVCSDEARYIDAQTIGQRRHLQKLNVFGNLDKALTELVAVWEESRNANWDGYDASPVEEDTYLNSRRFVELLPLGFPMPSIGVEADGALTLEWYRSAHRLLSISVNPNHELHFAGMFGVGNSVYGTADFFDSIPNNIMQLILMVES